MVDDDKATLRRRLRVARRALGCDIHLSVITNPRNRSMSFVPLTDTGQPAACSRALAPRWLDLVLVPLVGLAFDRQRVDRLPVAPHDVPLRGIVTERGFYRGIGR